jgi:hypothetical protein
VITRTYCSPHSTFSSCYLEQRRQN